MILEKIYRNLTAPIDTEAGQLTNIPDFVIAWVIFMSGNAILQAFADIFLEIAILTEVVSFKIPLRLEFLFLTVLSTVIAYLTLKGLREGNMDVTQNTLIIGLIVETSLVLGDTYLLFNTDKDFWIIFAVRLPFMILTSMNILIISDFLRRRLQAKKSRPNYRF